MDSIPLITLFCLSMGRVRFLYMYKVFIEIVQLSSYPSGRWLHRISQRLSRYWKCAAMTPIKVSGDKWGWKSNLNEWCYWTMSSTWRQCHHGGEHSEIPTIYLRNGCYCSVCVCVWGIRGNKNENKSKGSVGYLFVLSQVCQTKTSNL